MGEERFGSFADERRRCGSARVPACTPTLSALFLAQAPSPEPVLPLASVAAGLVIALLSLSVQPLAVVVAALTLRRAH